ncbi:hypothetical protein ACFU6I_25340 [Streptomyces sp. NPDC057486]|uniref:hypothetical protein n=1 Tax=Streptomyces sp. NPDC057486 TaxID=3346145 RepID=UPI00367ECE36
MGKRSGHMVHGVVARGKGADVTPENIVVPDPGPGEALVRVQACGVFRTDLHVEHLRLGPRDIPTPAVG